MKIYRNKKFIIAISIYAKVNNDNYPPVNGIWAGYCSILHYFTTLVPGPLFNRTHITRHLMAIINTRAKRLYTLHRGDYVPSVTGIKSHTKHMVITYTCGTIAYLMVRTDGYLINTVPFNWQLAG